MATDWKKYGDSLKQSSVSKWREYGNQIKTANNFEGLKQRISKLYDFENTVIKNSEKLADGWYDKQSSNAFYNTAGYYYAEAESIKRELETNGNAYKKIIGDKEYKALYDSLNNSTKTKDATLERYKKRIDLYSNYENADDYNKAKRDYQLDTKYAKLKTYEDYEKYYNSGNFEQANLPKDEKEYLLRLGYTLKYREVLSSLNAANQRLEWLKNNPTVTKQQTGELAKNIKSLEQQKNEMDNMGGIYTGLNTEVLSGANEYAFDQRWANKQSELEEQTKATSEKDRIKKMAGLPTTEDEKQKAVLTDKEKIKLMSGQKVDKSDYYVDDIFKKAEPYQYLYYATDDEKRMYSYIKEHDGEGLAQKYLEDLKISKLDKRLNEALMKEAYDYSAESGGTGFLGILASIPTNLMSGVEFGAYRMAGLDGVRSTLASQSQGYREGTKTYWDSEILDFLYDTGMSGVDSVAAGVLSKVVPFLGEFLLGSSAAASAYNDALDRGISHGDALLTAITAGAAESFFEHISISKFLDGGDITKGFTKAGLKQGVKNAIAEIGINASEEFATELTNVVTDTLINGGLSNYAIAVKDYYMQGMTPEDAKSKALADLGKQIGLAGGSGALMGFGFGNISSVKGMASSQISNSRKGGFIKANSNINELKTMANLSGTLEIKAAAEKLSESSKPSEIGYVYNSLLENAVENSIKEMTPILLENGAKESGSNSAKGWAAQIARSVFESKDSPKVANLLTNKITSDVYTEFAKEGKYGGDTILALKEMTQKRLTEMGVEGDSTEAMSKSEENTSAFDEPNVAEDNTSSQTLVDIYYKVPTKDQSYIKEVGAKLGRKVVFEHTIKNKGFKSDGYIDKKGIIHIDYAIKNPLQFIFKHELTHFLEKNKATYSDFANIVMDSEVFIEWVKSKGYKSVEAYNTSLIDLYSKIDSDFDEPKANKEMLANFVGEKLFGNDMASLEELLKAMEPEQRRTFMEFIKDFIKWLKQCFVKDKSLSAQIERFEKEFIKAYKAAETEFEQQKTAEDNGGEEFSIQKVSDESSVVIVDTDQGIFVGAEPSEYSKIARQYFNEHFKNVTLPLGDNDAVSMSKKMPGEYAYPHTTLDKNSPEYASKMKAITELDNLLKTAHNHSFSQDTKGNPEATLGWDYYEVEFLCDGKQVSGLINIANSEKGRVFYDMTKIKVAPAISEKYVALLARSQSTSQVATNNNVPQKSKVVKNNISEKSQNDTDSAEFLYVGEKSNTSDKLKLSTAKDWLKKGIDSETIRKETGWFKGMDGKWRFEINDKDAKINIKTILKDLQLFIDFSEAREKQKKGEIASAEFVKIATEFLHSDVSNRTLEDYFSHGKLFEAYPELAEVSIGFKNLDIRGAAYAPELNCIYIDPSIADSGNLLVNLKKMLIHEIQHVIQYIEGFTKGASGIYWQARKENGELFLDENGNEISNQDLYKRTAGEIEAYDAAERYLLNDDYRKEIRPDIDRTDVVFADKEVKELVPFGTETVQYSIPSDHNYVYTNGKASFTEERFNNLFDEHSLGDGKRAEHSNAYVAYISPEDFVNLTSNANIRGRVEDEAYILNEDELKNEKETPFLEYNPATGEVVDHEGRHRMVALKADGIESVAVVLKPSNDSFERRTVQDISLTGQNFAGGKANGNITVKNAIPLSEKYRTEAVAQFAKNPDADVRYSLPMEDADTLLDMYEHKQITREEYLSRLNQSRNRKAETPLDIARMTKEDANTTPPLKRKQGEAKGDSESKLYTSLQKSDIFNDEFKAEFRKDSFIKKYQSVGNAETMREAAKELDAGGQAYVLAWSGKDAKHASLIDIAVGFILLDRYQRIGDKESAAAIGEKLREMATASGQQVQIFSILGRFDADSMVLYAQMELSKAFKVFADEKTEHWAKNNADRFNLTDSDVEFIRRRTFQAAEMPENSREKAVLLGEIAARVQDKLPPNKGQAYKAFQRIAMLLNPKTIERNIGGNLLTAPVFIASDYFGTAIDKIISLKTGVRTTGTSGIERLVTKSGREHLNENIKAFGKGVYESYDDFKRHIHTKQEELNRFSVGNAKSFNENHKGLLKPINTISKILNAADRLTSFCLEVGDRPFYEMWFINSLNNQMRLNNVTEATPEMVEIATEEALERTWQNDNYMTKAAAGARTFLNYLSYPVYKVFGVGLGDVFIKFTKTPANLAKALIDFSPVSIAKVGYDAIQLKNAIEKGEFDATLQKKLVNDISKSIMGILVMMLTAALSEMGALTGGGDDDKDLAYFEKNLAGKAPYSVIIGDTSVSYEWLQPISGLVAMVTDYMKSAKEKPDNEWYDNLKEAFKAGGTVLFNQSFMKNIQQLFSSDDIFGNLWDGILSEPSVFVPQILSQTASAMDEYSRDTYENDNLQTALNKVKVKIPGLRETLPKSVDTLGNEMENQRYGIFNSFFNPANVYPENSGAVADEVYGLYKSTGDATVMPRKAPYNLTVKGVKHTFGTEERAEFQKIVGTTSNDIIDNLLNERDYEDLSNSQKVELITKVYNYATAKAKSNVVYSYEVISAMYGGSISQELYNRLTEAEKKKLAELYFMDDYYDSKYKPKFKQGEEAEYFLKKLLDKYEKEENQSKKDKYKQKELNKILN